MDRFPKRSRLPKPGECFYFVCLNICEIDLEVNIDLDLLFAPLRNSRMGTTNDFDGVEKYAMCICRVLHYG